MSAHEERFEEVLPRVGFTMTLEPGELVLPAPVFGARSRFNASGGNLVHRDRPKEEVCHMVEWHWKQWAGGGELEDKSDWRSRLPELVLRPESFVAKSLNRLYLAMFK